MLNLTLFERVIPDPAFRDELLNAHVAQDTSEFDVKVQTMVGLILQSTFTAAAIVQLTNQGWIKSITRDSAARLC
jgi:hypothetical protein